MKLPVTIDCCAWNYLFEQQLDLAIELPKGHFTLMMPREVEIEIDAIPDIGKDGNDKRALKTYIANSIASNQIQTTSVFGFASVESDGSLSPTQVYGGFDQGTFQSDKDRHFYATNEIKKQLSGKKPRPTRLAANQADAAIAVRSFDSIVLTNECKTKDGPLNFAAKKNGKVLYLSDLDLSKESLANYIRKFM